MNKTVLITGATGATGSATALEIARSGATTILGGRNKSKLEALKQEIIRKTGNQSIDLLVADLSDVSAIKNASKEFIARYPKLDVLINTAAVYRAKRELNKNGWEMMFATNHMAPFTMTHELMPALKAAGNSRVITVTAPSTTKLNFGDLQGEKKFTALNAFGASKMANLLFTYTLARTSKENGITATAFFPGLVKSELTNEMPAFLRFFLKLISSSPDKASKAISKLALAPEYQNANGKFFDKNGKELKSDPYSYDVNMQDRLQTISETLIK